MKLGAHNRLLKVVRTAFAVFLTGMLSACSVSKYIPDGSCLLDEVHVTTSDDSVSPSSLRSSLRQKPNRRVFGLFRWPMRVWCLSGPRDTYVNRTLRRMGEEPRLYNPISAEESCTAMRRSLVAQGWLKAEASVDTTVVHGNRVIADYHVEPGPLYRVRSLQWQCADRALLSEVMADTIHSLLSTGMNFSSRVLDSERTRLVTLLHDRGYYTFQKDLVTFVADTARGSTDVDLTVRLRGITRPHIIDSVSIVQADEPFMRQSLLESRSHIQPGDLYSASRVRDTYNAFSLFGAIRYTNIQFEETSDTTLKCLMTVTPARRMAAGIELDGTNTAGDLGVSSALSFTNRNLFHGSELLTVKLRGAYESITQLTDYAGDHYIEYGAEMGLNFPRLIMPFVSERFQARSRATTQLDLQWNSQDRPEFTRRVLSAGWGWLWNASGNKQHRLDLFGVNFVSVPVKDQYFIDHYLNQYNSRNSILKFNYEDLFIARTGYSFYYNSMPKSVDRNNAFGYWSVRAGVETAGNLLNGISQLVGARTDSLGQYHVGGIAFAQYVKGDFAWTGNLNIDSRRALVAHFAAGVAWPYGNSRMLPFEKRYYAGGANNVRGWSLRGLGPGSYVPRDGTIDYINQSGDMKLFASVEYRPHLFWKIDGALFVDAGNIWTIYDYDDQPGGQFVASDFLRQIAVAYGAGLRLDLGFIVVRFDGGMKAINPSADSGPLRYPIINPNFKRDFAWHFAVGYPF